MHRSRRSIFSLLAVLLWAAAGLIGSFGIFLVAAAIYENAMTPAHREGTSVYGMLGFGVIAMGIACLLHLLARSARRDAVLSTP